MTHTLHRPENYSKAQKAAAAAPAASFSPANRPKRRGFASAIESSQINTVRLYEACLNLVRIYAHCG